MMLHPDSGQQESYTAQGSVKKMRADFDGWEPRSACFNLDVNHRS